MFELAASASKLLLPHEGISARAVSTGIALSSALELPRPILSIPSGAILLACTVDHVTGRLELASSQRGGTAPLNRSALHMSAHASQALNPTASNPGTSIGRGHHSSHARRVLEALKTARGHMPVFFASIASAAPAAAAASGALSPAAAQVDSGLQLGAAAPALRGVAPTSLAVPVGSAGYCVSAAQLQFAVAAPLPIAGGNQGMVLRDGSS